MNADHGIRIGCCRPTNIHHILSSMHLLGGQILHIKFMYLVPMPLLHSVGLFMQPQACKVQDVGTSPLHDYDCLQTRAYIMNYTNLW